MKKIQFEKYAIILAGALLLGGCSQSAPADSTSVEVATVQSDSSQTETAQKEAKSIADLYTEIETSVTLYSPFCWDDDYISNYYGIDVSTLDEYVFSISEDATSAEAVIIMKAKDASDTAALSDCLQVVVDEKKNEMENYLPEQFEIVKKSSVQTKDNYVWLVISENADAITKIIEDGIQ